MVAAKRARRKPEDGQKRVVIEHVTPEIDAGRFPAKRVVGESVLVQADIFGDGHDHIEARLLSRAPKAKGWTVTPMTPLGNDRWHASFAVDAPGTYEFTIAASIDHFDTWQDGLRKKLAAGQDLALELRNGEQLVQSFAERAKGKEKKSLEAAAAWLQANAEELAALEKTGEAGPARAGLAAPGLDAKLAALAARYPDTELETRYGRTLRVDVDRKRARFSTWYELFPRSQGADAQTHGTLRDVESKLPYLQALGFDVLYLPPIHPVGRSFRKGRNNSVEAAEGEVGSPWAIGAAEGGHTAILPELGSLEDFEHLRQAAENHGMELALDIAFQCAPDHPWVKEHPSWFKHRADGSIQYAENPPKKYQDIYPLDFESEDWESLWDELAEVFFYWAKRGVRIFRVDNPHTKAFGFWEWCIAEVKQKYPDALFLAEAFTRPRVMEQLAKLGFSQSYTYFCWRTSKDELEQYLTELTQTEQWQYFRPNFWPNTPDINPYNLQSGGYAAFALRLVLAATMCSSYGIYGGAYENLEDKPFKPGGEEYLDSEKYEIKHWPLSLENPMARLIAAVNHARRRHPALQSFDSTLHFHTTDSPQLIAYSKRSKVAEGELESTVLTIVNLDPFNRQTGWVTLDRSALGLDDAVSCTVEDVLSGASYTWSVAPSSRNFVALDPQLLPAHLFVVKP
jgi:starch synthase (maltosyl-transferring)